jgi:fibronectin type 3 domain-containing protein
LKFQSHYLKVAVVLTLLFCIGIDTFGLQERPVRISPILIKWNNEAKIFNTYFDVTNDTNDVIDITSIIIFKIGRYRRWRGTRLPVIKPHRTDSFKLSFSPGIMLKNEYASITVNIYGKDYVGLIDYSSRYLKVSTKHLTADGKTQIELTEVPTKAVAPLAKPKASAKAKAVGKAKTPEEEKALATVVISEIPKKRIIVMGEAIKRPQLLATEQFQNAILEPISAAEKQQVVEDVKPEPEPAPEPPPAPENLSISSGKYQNQLTWKLVEGASAYHLYWSKTRGVTPQNGTKINNVGLGYIHSNLKEAVPFYYIVTAERDGLESEASKEISTIPLAPPGIVTQLTVLPDKFQNRLQWKPVKGATTYHLYWSKFQGVTNQNGAKIENVASGYVHTDLNEAVSYYYVVTAEKDGLESAPSAEATGKPLIPPQKTPELTITPEKFQNRLTWKLVEDATTYNLYWSKVQGVTPENGAMIQKVESGFVHADLHEELPFYYILTAEKDGLESAPSKEVSGRPLSPPKGTPQLIATSEKFQNRLAW